MSKFNILILGASYGSLLASKILFGGHSVKLVCLPEEANLINSEGFRVRLPVRGRAEPVEIDSRKLSGKVSAAGANDVDPRDYDLIGSPCRSRNMAHRASADCSTRSQSRMCRACRS